MVFAILGGLMERLDWLGVLWGGLWAGLVAFSLGLSFLLWTRWGEYHLTGKCVIFSLLAHTIIGLFFATAEVVEDVVVALNPVNEPPPITIDRVRLLNASEDDDDSSSTVDGRSEQVSAPGMWDRVTGRAPIESVSLVPEGPDSQQSQPLERTNNSELTPLPQRTPQPQVPLASAKPNDPQLSRPQTEVVERAEMAGTPRDTAATSASSTSEVLPDSSSSRVAPPLGSSPVQRVQVAEPDSKNDSDDVGSARPAPRIGSTDSAAGPESLPRPIAPPVRNGTQGPDRNTISSGPVAQPEVTPKNAGSSRPEPRNSVAPSTSVRIGAPKGDPNATGDSAPSRSSSVDNETVAVPKVRIAGAGPASAGPGVTSSGVPDANALRSLRPSGVTGEGGADRTGIRLGTPEIYRERMNPNRSEQAVKRGGSKASEEAVDRALQWLALHQETDGHWDVDGFHAHCPAGRVCSGPGSQNRDDCAVTGLVLLAFLGAGNTHWDGKYSTNVRSGLNWLIQQEKSNGDLRGGGRMYSQGIATLALSEALGMTSDVKLRDPVERAAQFIIAAQNQTSGGWRYLPGQVGDTSVFGWQLMALKSASLAGIEVPETTWQKARGWLHTVGSGRHRGLASYQPTEAPTPPMTAEALVCRVFLGESTDNPTLREAADYLMQYKPQWSRLNLYYWYYGTLACFQMSGDYWTQWNTSVRDVLISHQVRDGHAAGSWDPNPTLDPWGREGGRIYSTALAALCLEVYYRFLPVQSLTSDDPPARGGAAARGGERDDSKAARSQ